MNKAEAIQAMQDGKKVTHRYFDSNEFIMLKDGMIETEEGYRCSIKIFWGHRTEQHFQTGWEIFTGPVTASMVAPEKVAEEIPIEDYIFKVSVQLGKLLKLTNNTNIKTRYIFPLSNVLPGTKFKICLGYGKTLLKWLKEL